MHILPSLATLHFPGTNPFGPASLNAAAHVVCLLVLTSGPFAPRIKHWLVAVAQPIFLGTSAITEGSPVYYIWWHGRSFPDGDDFVAAWLYLAVGLVCAVQCLRYPEVELRVCGALFSLVFGSFIVAQAVMIVWDFPVVFFGGWDLDWTPVVVALTVFTVVWASFVWFRVRRPMPHDHTA